MKSNIANVITLTMTLLFGVGVTVTTVFAAEEQPSSSPAPATTAVNNNQDIALLDQALSKIAAQKKAIKDLQARITKTSGITQNALAVRLDKTWLKLLEQNLAFADSVAAEEKAGVKVEKYRQQAIEILGSQADVANTAIQRIRSQIELPEPGLSAAEQAAAYARIYELLDAIHHAYDLLIQSLELSRQFELDVTKQEGLLKTNLAERAATGSIFLEMATNDVSALRASVSAVPDDAELKAKLTVATNHVRNLATQLAAVLTLMDKLEMDTAAYHEQVLSATGQITTDVFEVSVVTNLLVGWGQSLWDTIIKDGPNLVFKVLLFIVIVFGFRKLADFLQKLIERALEKSHLQLSELLRRMVVSIVRNLIIILGVRCVDCVVPDWHQPGPLTCWFGCCRFCYRLCAAGFTLQFCCRHDDSDLSPFRCW